MALQGYSPLYEIFFSLRTLQFWVAKDLVSFQPAAVTCWLKHWGYIVCFLHCMLYCVVFRVFLCIVLRSVVFGKSGTHSCLASTIHYQQQPAGEWGEGFLKVLNLFCNDNHIYFSRYLSTNCTLYLIIRLWRPWKTCFVVVVVFANNWKLQQSLEDKLFVVVFLTE